MSSGKKFEIFSFWQPIVFGFVAMGGGVLITLATSRTYSVVEFKYDLALFLMGFLSGLGLQIAQKIQAFADLHPLQTEMARNPFLREALQKIVNSHLSIAERQDIPVDFSHKQEHILGEAVKSMEILAAAWYITSDENERYRLITSEIGKSGDLVQATSFVDAVWWKSAKGLAYYGANLKVIRKKGKIKRIFILPDEMMGRLRLGYVQNDIFKIIRQQIRDGVDVRIVNQKHATSEHANILICDDRCATNHDDQDAIGPFTTIFYSEDQIRKIRTSFEELWQLSYAFPLLETYSTGSLELKLEIVDKENSPSDFSDKLAGAIEGLHLEKVQSAIDLGCGCGIQALVLAKLNIKKVYAIDTNAEVIEIARENIARNQVENTIEILHGDMYGPLRELAVDLIVCNPPTWPDFEDTPRHGRGGGSNGMRFLEEMISKSPRHLNPGGMLVFIVPSLIDMKWLLNLLGDNKMKLQRDPTKLHTRPFRPFHTSHLDYYKGLRENGGAEFDGENGDYTYHSYIIEAVKQ